MRGLLDITRTLLAADVPHEVVHLRRRIDHAAELPETLGVPATACVTVHLYDVPGGLAAALLPADTVPATTALARALRTPSLAPTPPARVAEVTDFHPALVPPVGLPAGVRVVTDRSLLAQPVVYTATGDGSTALKIRTADLLAHTGAVPATLVEPGGTVEQQLAVEDGWRGTPFGMAALRR